MVVTVDVPLSQLSVTLADGDDAVAWIVGVIQFKTVVVGEVTTLIDGTDVETVYVCRHPLFGLIAAKVYIPVAVELAGLETTVVGVPGTPHIKLILGVELAAKVIVLVLQPIV